MKFFLRSWFFFYLVVLRWQYGKSVYWKPAGKCWKMHRVEQVTNIIFKIELSNMNLNSKIIISFLGSNCKGFDQFCVMNLQFFGYSIIPLWCYPPKHYYKIMSSEVLLQTWLLIISMCSDCIMHVVLITVKFQYWSFLDEWF